MKQQKLILIGGGGHCKSVIEAIQSLYNIELSGILDPSVTGDIMGIPVIGTDAEIEKLVNQDYQFLITVGQIGNSFVRNKLFDLVKSHNGRLMTLAAETATVAASATLGEGTVIMQHGFVNAEAVIGANCIINTKVLIEHEVVIGNNTHIATGALVNGQCRIGNNCFIGSRAVIANNITIADNVIVGAGSVVVKDITEAGTYFGNPAKKKR